MIGPSKLFQDGSEKRQYVFDGPVGDLGATRMDTHRITYASTFAFESTGTFLLVNAVLHTAVQRSASQLAPVAIGMTETICILDFGVLAGGCVNSPHHRPCGCDWHL